MASSGAGLAQARFRAACLQIVLLFAWPCEWFRNCLHTEVASGKVSSLRHDAAGASEIRNPASWLGRRHEQRHVSMQVLEELLGIPLC